MKDEEIADKYAEEYFGKKTELVEVWKLKSCKENFLAGLKAGRPQWHDLRKDPNDLPNDGRIVSDQEGNNVKYVVHLGEWFYRHITCKANVIAWCEIPTFDKE